MNKFIILDRDGVINFDSIEYIKSPAEWEAIPGSLEAIAKLNHAGYEVLIVTNQSGIARGYFDLDTLFLIHDEMLEQIAAAGGSVKEIFYCPHHPKDGCNCRKPKPGMLQQIAEKYHLQLKDTYFIGDSASDVHAAEAAGCLPILVRTGNGELALQRHPEFAVIPHFENLAKAIDAILSQESACLTNITQK